jgi:hypothetical protein
MEQRFWPKVDVKGDDECWPWMASLTSMGYGQIQYQMPTGKWRPTAASRVAYELVHGEIPAGAEIMHVCDNPPCCNPAHLRAGSHTDNMRDMFEKGRCENFQRKLDEDKVREIRRRAGAETQAALAREFGVGPDQISRIVNRRQWKGVV